MISDDGVPTVKRRRDRQTLKAAEKLAAAIERRMPERSLSSTTQISLTRPRTFSPRPCRSSGNSPAPCEQLSALEE
ncbi:hypothetical protein ACFQYP_19790 [Nonomuraea antimicrobica]